MMPTRAIVRLVVMSVLIGGGGFMAGKELIAPRLARQVPVDTVEFHLRGRDTVQLANGWQGPIDSLLRAARKPLVVFFFRPLCASCATDLDQVADVVMRDSLALWIVVVDDSFDSRISIDNSL